MTFLLSHQVLIGEVDKLDALDAGDLCDGGEDGVFLCVVELAKPVKGFPGSRRVNCKLDEEINGRLNRCFYSFAGSFKIDSIVPGRKFRVPVPGASITADKLPCGVVERCAEIVNSVAQDEGQLGRQRSVKDDLEKQRAIFLTVDVNGVSVVVGEGFKGSLKICDVPIGSLNFQARAFKHGMEEHGKAR